MLQNVSGDAVSLKGVSSADREGPRSAPVAVISHSALARNAARLDLREGIALPADAFGHGFVAVQRTLSALGVPAVDDEVVDPRIQALLGLEPGTEAVMRVTGSVLGVKALRAGEGVSYGYTHRAEHDTRIALVVGGYAQGVVRGLGGRAWVSISGAPHRIVGRVAMDVCVVDIGDAPVRRGDAAVLLGDRGAGEPTASDWSTATGLGELELVTAIGSRAIREDQQ